MAILIAAVAACAPPRPQLGPPPDTLSPECLEFHKGGYSRAKLDAAACDLYEKVAALEKRVAELESRDP